MDPAIKRERAAERVGLLQLAGVLLKVGATGFGGAMPMLALVHTEYLKPRMSLAEILENESSKNRIKKEGWNGQLVNW